MRKRRRSPAPEPAQPIQFAPAPRFRCAVHGEMDYSVNIHIAARPELTGPYCLQCAAEILRRLGVEKMEILTPPPQ